MPEDTELVDAHEIFLSKIAIGFAGNTDNSYDILREACDLLLSIIIPPECLLTIEERLVSLWRDESDHLDSMEPNDAMRRLKVLKGTVKNIHFRVMKLPAKKAKKKRPRRPRPAADKPAREPRE